MLHQMRSGASGDRRDAAGEWWNPYDLFRDEPLPCPSRGSLWVADVVLIPLSIIAYAAGAMFQLWSLGRADARWLGTLTFAAFTIALAVRAILGRMWNTAGFWFRLSRKWPRGVLGGTLGLIAVVCMAVVDWLDLPATIHWSLWPLFLPGLIYIVRSRTYHVSDKRRPISGLTCLVLAYTALAAGIVLIPYQNGLIVPAMWTGTTLLVTYYLMRRADIVQLHGALLLRISDMLSRMEDVTAALPEIAALLQRSLHYDHLAILVPVDYEEDDGERGAGSYLRVVGAAGTDAERSHGFLLPTGVGITWRAVRDRRLQLVNNTAADQDYIDGGLVGIHSELDVPIFDIDEPERVLAVVSVKARARGAFSWRDEAIVKQVCHLLAGFARKRSSPTEFYERLLAEVDGLASAEGQPDVIDAALGSACRLFSGIHTYFVPLGLGTGAVLFGRIRHRGTTAGAIVATPDGDLAFQTCVTRCANDWASVFYGAAYGSSNESLERWARREDFAAAALLPVGSRRQRVGILVVCFAVAPARWPSVILRLAIFAQAITPHLMSRHKDALYGGFLRPALDLHALLQRENLGRGQIEYRLRVEQQAPVRDMLLGVRRVFERIYRAGALPNLGEMSLEQALSLSTPDLVASDVYVEWHIDPSVEESSFELRVILYRLLTEAVLNAASHGNAKMIVGRVAREAEQLVIDVKDNGTGFAPGALAPGASGGMRMLLAALKEFCGAELSETSGPAAGARLRLAIPMPPDEPISARGESSPGEVEMV